MPDPTPTHHYPATGNDGSRSDHSSSKRAIQVGGVGNVTIQITYIGQGPPVAYLHGLLGLNSHWIPTANALSERFRSVLVEIPLLQLQGAHRSIDGVTTLTIEAIEQAIGEPAVLVGSSFGGHVALRVAEERPDLVTALVLVGASGLFEEPFEEELEQRLTTTAPIRPSRDWLTRRISELFYDRSKVPEGVIDRAYEELSNRRGARAMVKLSRSCRRDYMGSRLSEIKAPTLVLWGKQDIVTPPRVAEAFHDLLPDSRIHWIDGCGHAPMIESPEEFTAALNAFLIDLESRPDPAIGARQEVA